MEATAHREECRILTKLKPPTIGRNVRENESMGHNMWT